MRKVSFVMALLWCALALHCYHLCVKASANYQRVFDEETFFLNPVLFSPGQTLLLRNDAFGKGYFHAPRGSHNQRLHQGVDLVSRVGDPIFASKSGRVSRSFVNGGYGEFVEIFHPYGLMTRYAHLKTRYVKAGQWVSAGTVIGLSGKTGNADEAAMIAHLHYEIRDSQEALDPTSTQLLDPKFRVIT